MVVEKSFGEYLKKLRIHQEISMRELARKTGIDVAYLSRIERGINPAPQKKEILEKIVKALNLNDDDTQELFNLAAIENNIYPEDIREKLKNNKAIPLLLRTIANKNLTEDEIKQLAEELSSEL